MATTSSIIGQYEANKAASATTDRVATDKDTFLKLLVAQLTHQDPLNPVEDKEFIAQLAQFTQVEELQNLNTGMEQLNASYLATQATNAAGLIGMRVVAGGDNLYLSGAANFASKDDYPYIYYEMPRDSESGVINVYSTGADGSSVNKLVYSQKIDARTGGVLHAFGWDGRDGAGNVMPDGNYIVNVTAVDEKGESMLVSTSSTGTVIGVETQADGNHKLYLNDQRTVNFNAVDLITVPASNNGVTLETLKETADTLALAAKQAKMDAETARTAADAVDKDLDPDTWETLDKAATELEEYAAKMAETAEAAQKQYEDAKKAAEEAKK